MIEKAKARTVAVRCGKCRWKGRRGDLAKPCGKCGHAPLTPTIPKPSKYKNRKTVIQGITFDSKKEANRWVRLKAMEASGAITGLRRQVTYTLAVNETLIASYIADHVYVESGLLVVEDVKSEITRKLPVYRLKRKLMRAIHGVEIREV